VTQRCRIYSPFLARNLRRQLSQTVITNNMDWQLIKLLPALETAIQSSEPGTQY
jgi:hypothetical protein